MINFKDVKYLVFDVESVPDAKLIKLCKYPNEELSEDEAVRKYQAELLESSDGVSDFVPATFQFPVSVTVGKVSAEFELLDIVCLDEPKYRASEMTKLFWLGVEDLYNHASLVTFNGRGFDIPLLELMAYRYGITVKRHFNDKFAARYRFGTKHIDLQDFLSNFGAIRMNGGLNLLAKILGKPGKMGTVGSDVYDMYLEGKIREINNYCVHDVLDTYFVFLRTRVLAGELSVSHEQAIVKNTKEYIIKNMEKNAGLKEYYNNWGDWEPWP